MDTIKIKTMLYYNNPKYHKFMPKEIFRSLEESFLNNDEFTEVPKELFNSMMSRYYKNTKKKNIIILAILLGLALLIAFAAIIKSHVSNKTYTHHELTDQMLIQNAENSDQKEKNTFLSFRFGMTQKEIGKHFDSLLKVKKIYLDNGNEYTYNFNTDIGVYKVKFKTYLNNDSLYKINFRFDVLGDGLKKSDLATMMAIENFKKAGKGFKCLIIDEKSCEYKFVKDNLIVQFKDDGLYGNMTYINAPIEKKVKDIDQKERNDKNNSTISDFN